VTSDPRELLRELAQTDQTAVRELAELDELAEQVEELRRRALSLTALLARLPAERERNAAAIVEAEAEVGTARETYERAHEELEAAERGNDRERAAAARRFEVRARDSLHVAERRLAEARAERKRLAVEEETAHGEAPQLEERAGGLAASLAGRPRVAGEAGERPGPGLDGVVEWARSARAALLVANGQLDAEREAVVRQANELGAAVLGRPVGAASAALVARRLEEALGDDG
jgi:hypothetical protein